MPDGRRYYITVLIRDSKESDETNASVIAAIRKQLRLGFASRSHRSAAFLFELRRRLTYDPFMVLSSSVRFVLQQEAQRIGLLSGGQFVAFINIEQRNHFSIICARRNATSRKAANATLLSTSNASRFIRYFESSSTEISDFFVDFTSEPKFSSKK